MEGETRRKKIIEYLEHSKQPISGSELSKKLKVSRQVIVQDIALLRAVNKNILSTNKGYIIYAPEVEIQKKRKTIRVKHNTEQILDELYAIVDCGGKVLDVVVEHDIYGQITVDLIITCRQDADEFISKIKNSQVQPLKELTGGVHMHTVQADSEEILNKIEKVLKEKGYFYKD